MYRNVYDKIIKRESNTRNLNWIYQSNVGCAKHNKLNDNYNVMTNEERTGCKYLIHLRS